jgi:hypothetical protein
MVKKTAAFRQRRAADTARWRERLHRGAAVYPVEVDGTTFDLMERYGGLKDSKTGDRQAVATALGRLLRRALQALLREEAGSRLSYARGLINAGSGRMSALGANGRSGMAGMT